MDPYLETHPRANRTPTCIPTIRSCYMIAQPICDYINRIYTFMYMCDSRNTVASGNFEIEQSLDNN